MLGYLQVPRSKNATLRLGLGGVSEMRVWHFDSALHRESPEKRVTRQARVLSPTRIGTNENSPELARAQGSVSLLMSHMALQLGERGSAASRALSETRVQVQAATFPNLC